MAEVKNLTLNDKVIEAAIQRLGWGRFQGAVYLRVCACSRGAGRGGVYSRGVGMGR